MNSRGRSRLASRRSPTGARSLAVACLLALLALSAPALARADTTLVDDITFYEQFTSFGGTTLWVDEREIDPGVVVPRLFTLRNGTRDELLIPVPFGQRDQPPRIDMGTDASGRTTLVYHRCLDRNGDIPDNVDQADCDVYSYTLGDEDERRVGSASTRACRETQPAIWGGGIVVRRSRMTRGCKRGLWYIPRRGKPRRLTTRFPHGLDLKGSRVLAAFGDGGFEFGARQRQTIEVLSTRSRSRRELASYDNSDPEGPKVSRPRLEGRYAYWAVIGRVGETCIAEIVRASPRGTESSARALRPARQFQDFAVDGDQVLYSKFVPTNPGDPTSGGAHHILRADDPPAAFTGAAPFGGPCPPEQ